MELGMLTGFNIQRYNLKTEARQNYSAKNKVRVRSVFVPGLKFIS